MAQSPKEKAITQVMTATGQSREEVLALNPKLAEATEAAATRGARGDGPMNAPQPPAGVATSW